MAAAGTAASLRSCFESCIVVVGESLVDALVACKSPAVAKTGLCAIGGALLVVAVVVAIVVEAVVVVVGLLEH